MLPLVLVFCDEEEELAPPVDRLAGVVVVAMVVVLAVLAVDAALANGDDVVDVDDTLSFFWLDMVAVATTRADAVSSAQHVLPQHTDTRTQQSHHYCDVSATESIRLELGGGCWV